MEFKILGPVVVTASSGAVELGGAKQRTILAMLIAHVGRAVSPDLLIEAVYGDQPHQRARRTISTYVSTLRGLLGDEIEKVPGGWSLRAPTESVDYLNFEDFYASVTSDTSAQEASATLREALDLWTGQPYADVEAHGSLDAEITRLSGLKEAALVARDRCRSGDRVLRGHPSSCCVR